MHLAKALEYINMKNTIYVILLFAILISCEKIEKKPFLSFEKIIYKRSCGNQGSVLTFKNLGLTWMSLGFASGTVAVTGHAGSSCCTDMSRAYSFSLENMVGHVCRSLNIACLVFSST